MCSLTLTGGVFPPSSSRVGRLGGSAGARWCLLAVQLTRVLAGWEALPGPGSVFQPSTSLECWITGRVYRVLLPLMLFPSISLLLVFAYRDTMGGHGSERDDQLTLRSDGGDEGLICVEENQFLASNRWVRWYGHLT